MTVAVPVLCLGAAVAVLGTGLGKSRAAHDRAAMDMLRTVTGRTDIVITRRDSGRPRLEPPYPELSVSMSYREGLLLVGFDPAFKVGVDIECGGPSGKLDPSRLARDHFSPAEADAVGAQPSESALDLFLRLWVAKEAVLKLTGRGIHDGMSEPDFSRHMDVIRGNDGLIGIGGAGGAAFTDVVLGRPVLPGIAARPYCALARAH